MNGDGFLDRVYERLDGDQNHRLYADWATTYDDELTANGYATPARVAATLARMLAERADPVLDVGCGTGLSGRALAEQGFEVVDGVDYSEEMLGLARATGAYRSLAVTNMNEPPTDLPGRSYAAVVAVGAFGFGHVESGAFAELVRVARPGAPIVIGCNEPYWLGSDLSTTIEAAVDDRDVVDLATMRGDHIPGHGVAGWVVAMRRSGAPLSG